MNRTIVGRLSLFIRMIKRASVSLFVLLFLCNSGWSYAAGEGVGTETADRYRKAAEQGDAVAQNGLGVCYANGWGVEKNMSEAACWFRKAAELGDARAQYNFGVCYANGWGVEKNMPEAVIWYRKAAEQGDAMAQEALSELGVK